MGGRGQDIGNTRGSGLMDWPDGRELQHWDSPAPEVPECLEALEEFEARRSGEKRFVRHNWLQGYHPRPVQQFGQALKPLVRETLAPRPGRKHTCVVATSRKNIN
jgi:hypothetical protein